MSQHSMRRGSDGEAQALLEIAQALAHVVALPLLLDEGVARVVAGHREEIDAVPALGEQERHLVPGAVGEPLCDARDALRLEGEHDLVRNEGRRRCSSPPRSSRARPP